MSDRSRIEWCDTTWNPTTGCTRVSAGCSKCYIERTPPFRKVGRRFDGDGPGSTTGVLLHPDRLDTPLRWRKPRRVFVNSLSDLFHDDISDDYVARVFATIAVAHRHTFQVLTKRPARMRALLTDAKWMSWVEHRVGDIAGEYEVVWPLRNLWVGVSVEDQQTADVRIPKLLATPAAVRFLSCEPLLACVDLWTPRYQLPDGGLGSAFAWGRGVGWLICGGESGPGARPMHPQWARDLRDQCAAADVPFLFKQWGEWSPAAPADATHLIHADGRIVGRDSATSVVGYGTVSPTRQDLVDRGHPGWARVRRVGKKAAGRLLDGRTWDEFPP